MCYAHLKQEELFFKGKKISFVSRNIIDLIANIPTLINAKYIIIK